MITNRAGTPIKDVLKLAALRKAERALHRRPVSYLVGPDGERSYRVMKDKLGDPYRIYRVYPSLSGVRYAQAQRAKNGVGRPPLKLSNTIMVPA